MDKNKLQDIIEGHKDKSNKDLLEAADTLKNEFEETKELLLKLTKHLDFVEEAYFKVYNELKGRARLTEDNG
tara:strand:+ start:327 stop:542 length:216 start_codon:yes stop_codon:yes gene_type:complete